MPVFLTGNRPVNKWVQRVSKKPLVFRTKEVGISKEITLVPFYQLSPQRYSLYWDVDSCQSKDTVGLDKTKPSTSLPTP